MDYVVSHYSFQLTYNEARRTFYGYSDTRKAEMLKEMLFTNYDYDICDLESREQALAYKGEFTVEQCAVFCGSVINFSCNVAEEWAREGFIECTDTFYIDADFDGMVEKLNRILY